MAAQLALSLSEPALAFKASETVPLAVPESQTEQHFPPDIYGLCPTHPLARISSLAPKQPLIYLPHLNTSTPAILSALCIPAQIFLICQGPL